MTCRAAFHLLPLSLFAAALWGGPAAPPARAQKGEPLTEAMVRDFEKAEKRGAFEALLRGDREFNAKADAPLVRLAARYYVERVTLPAQQKNLKALRDYAAEFDNLMSKARPDKKKQAVLGTLSRDLTRSFRQVLELDMKQWRPAVLHAAFMLEPLGRMGQPGVGDFLAGLVKDGKHDVIKLYALKGLQQYFEGVRAYFQAKGPGVVFSLHIITEDEYKGQPDEVGRVRLAGWLEPVLAFLARPAPKGDGEEVDAYRFLRREAVKALAASGVPLVPLVNKKGSRAPVAYGLVRVLVGGKDALDPPATLAERLEAALGLCAVKTEVGPRPQPDLVVGLVGKTLAEMGTAYRDDQVNFGNKNNPVPPRLPWKAYADRVKQALKDLQTNLPAGPARTNAKALEKAVTPLLDQMRVHRPVTDLGPLQDAVRGLPRPSSSGVYEGAAEPQVDVSGWPWLEG